MPKFDAAKHAGGQPETVKLLLKKDPRKIKAEDTAKVTLDDPKAYGYGY